MTDDLVDVLAESRLFSGFSADQLQEVILHLHPKAVTLKPRDQVYTVGDIADRCWLIRSGNLMLRRTSLRSPFLHMVYNRGSVTGIQGLVDPGSRRDVSMIAEDEVELIEITRQGVAQLNSDTQILFWKNVSGLLMRKLAICLSHESLDD